MQTDNKTANISLVLFLFCSFTTNSFFLLSCPEHRSCLYGKFSAIASSQLAQHLDCLIHTKTGRKMPYRKVSLSYKTLVSVQMQQTRYNVLIMSFRGAASWKWLPLDRAGLVVTPVSRICTKIIYNPKHKDMLLFLLCTIF